MVARNIPRNHTEPSGLLACFDINKAHDALDREVDRALVASRKLSTERQRLELLFARYAESNRLAHQEPVD